jgi:hypothetical protein
VSQIKGFALTLAAAPMPVTEKVQKAFEINARVFTFSVIRQPG